MFELLLGGILYFFRFSRAEGIKAVTLISQRDTKLANKKNIHRLGNGDFRTRLMTNAYSVLAKSPWALYDVS
jgi:hypothetical protein